MSIVRLDTVATPTNSLFKGKILTPQTDYVERFTVHNIIETTVIIVKVS